MSEIKNMPADPRPWLDPQQREAWLKAETCLLCEDALRDVWTALDSTRRERDEDHARLMSAHGALVDSGVPVPPTDKPIDGAIRQLTAQRDSLRDALENVEPATDLSLNEATAYPWWAIVEQDESHRLILVEGPFFSRAAATEVLEARHYDYGDKAFVFCFSGHRSWSYRNLLDQTRTALTQLKEARYGGNHLDGTTGKMVPNEPVKPPEALK